MPDNVTVIRDAQPLLAVRDLVVTFGTGRSAVSAVSGISFDVPASGMVGIVGKAARGSP